MTTTRRILGSGGLIAAAALASWLLSASIAAAGSPVPVQFAVQTSDNAAVPVRTADYSSADQASVTIEPVHWGWGRPYYAYYGPSYAYGYAAPAPYVTYYNGPGYVAPYTTYYGPAYYYTPSYTYYPRRAFYGPRFYYRW